MREPTETPAYYEAELLQAQNALQLYRNNAAAFRLRMSTAETRDAWADARGSEQYWSNKAFCQMARVRHLEEMLRAASTA